MPASESTLVKMPHCWKSHVTAHLPKDSNFFCFSSMSCIRLSNSHCLASRIQSSIVSTCISIWPRVIVMIISNYIYNEKCQLAMLIRYPPHSKGQ